MKTDREIIIKTALLKAGLRLVDIASELEISRASVSDFVKGTKKSAKFDQWCRKNLGISFDVQEVPFEIIATKHDKKGKPVFWECSISKLIKIVGKTVIQELEKEWQKEIDAARSIIISSGFSEEKFCTQNYNEWELNGGGEIKFTTWFNITPK
jgi:transcriptional regulator with XRE-family HTH domain